MRNNVLKIGILCKKTSTTCTHIHNSAGTCTHTYTYVHTVNVVKMRPWNKNFVKNNFVTPGIILLLMF
jgi:hypothetical protein